MFNRKEYMKQWRIENKEYKREYMKKYRQDNKEHRKEYQRIWKENHPFYNKQWRKENPEIIKAYKTVKNKQERNRRKIDLKYNLNHRIGKAVWKSLNGNKNGKSWEDIVGYSCIKLIRRLKKTMPKGYTWNDYLDGKLHIDHIIPISAFNFTTLKHIDFKKCWALNNLRLLPAEENLKKGCKLTKPFQPALQI